MMDTEVAFVSWHQAKELARVESVVFAEVLGSDDGALSLEIHVMHPHGKGLHEAQRDDTGPVAVTAVRQRVAQVAAENGCRYAAIGSAEKDWPPDWVEPADPNR
jgi:hypothetical protein